MVTHSSILAWRIPWTEELAGPVYSGSCTPVYEDGHYYYHFDLPSDYIDAGYYVIAVNESSSGGRLALSVCQVVD